LGIGGKGGEWQAKSTEQQTGSAAGKIIHSILNL
jgi:hypothetical protein